MEKNCRRNEKSFQINKTSERDFFLSSFNSSGIFRLKIVSNFYVFCQFQFLLEWKRQSLQRVAPLAFRSTYKFLFIMKKLRFKYKDMFVLVLQLSSFCLRHSAQTNSDNPKKLTKSFPQKLFLLANFLLLWMFIQFRRWKNYNI